MRPLKSVRPNAAHETLMKELKEAIGRHPELSAEEMLALAAQLVGNLIALQDQTRFTVEEVMETVEKNIEEGNRQAIAGLMKPKGNG